MIGKPFKKGQVGYWKGKKRPPFTDKAKKNMSLVKLGNKSRLGIKHTKEVKKKISDTLLIVQPKGNKHWNWRGGITSKNDIIRHSMEVKLWRKSVFERDNFICQKTKQKGGKIVAHHINNFADFPELRTSIENGITLSKESHKEFHKIYGVRNNTKEQLLEFLTPK